MAGLSRRLGRGGGSVVGGRAILAIDPHALRRLAIGHAIALVSGTNGKTTTTSLLAAALADRRPGGHQRARGQPPARPGRRPGGRPTPAAPAALEVDEAWMGRVVAATRPQVAVLLNLSRDQLDRNNEVRRLASGLAGHVRRAGAPARGRQRRRPAGGVGCRRRVRRDLGRRRPAVDGRRRRVPEVRGPHPVPRTGGVGLTWACSACDLRRPSSTCGSRTTNVVTLDGRPAAACGLRLPGRCNRANAALALAAAARLGVDPEPALRAMADITEVGGRYRSSPSGRPEPGCCWPRTRPGGSRCFDLIAPAAGAGGRGHQRPYRRRQGPVVAVGRALRASGRTAGGGDRGAQPGTWPSGSTTPRSTTSGSTTWWRPSPPPGRVDVDVVANYTSLPARCSPRLDAGAARRDRR